MNAIPSALSDSKIAEQRAHEPSMEEILASIRKIISDDQALPLSHSEEVHEVAAAGEIDIEAEVESALAPVIEQSARPKPALRAAEPEIERPRAPLPARPSFDAPREPAARFEAPPPRPVRPSAEVRDFAPRPVAPPPAISGPRLVPEQDDMAAPLLSDRANTSVSAAFKALGAARAMPGPEMLEQAAREMMRPMLKQWLDENLPSMVERLVKSEIERITRGG